MNDLLALGLGMLFPAYIITSWQVVEWFERHAAAKVIRYAKVGVTPGWQKIEEVRVDDKTVLATEANVDEGWAVIYKADEEGRLVQRYTGKLETEIVYGRIEIIPGKGFYGTRN